MSPGTDRSLMMGSRTLYEEGSRAAFEQLAGSRSGADDGAFSMLDSYGSSPSRKGAEKENSLSAGGTQITEERSSESQVQPSESALDKLSTVATQSLMPPPAQSDKQDPREFESPKKARRAIIHETPTRRVTDQPPMTPRTPFSPEFPSMFSPSHTLKMIGSPSMTLGTFPGGEASHLSAESNLVGPALSQLVPDGSREMKVMFEAGSDSRQSVGLQLEGPKTPSPAKSSPSDAYSTSTPLFGEPAPSLMGDDLDAISALNSLSSPPGKKRRSSRDSTEEESKKKSPSVRSLFAKVTAGKEIPKKKRKINF